MVNPDNFIMHSDFNYNAPVIIGYKDFADVTLPATFELTSGLLEGDRFRVIQEDAAGINVYSRGGPFPTFNYYREGDKLYAAVGAQSVGSKFSGRFHFRVYRKDDLFIFNSNTNIEKVIFSHTGTFNGGFGFNLKIPNTTGKKMALYGVWRVVGTDTWYSDGYSGNSPSGTLGLNHTISEITVAWGAGNNSGTQVEYRIIGVDLYDVSDSAFIINSETLPFAIPIRITTSMDTGTSLTAGQTRTTYSPWTDTSPGSLGVNAFLTFGGRTGPDFVQERPLRPGNFQPHVTIWVEKNSVNQVRIAMREVNNDSVAHSYTKATVTADFYMINIR